MRRLQHLLPIAGALLISFSILTACEESGIVGSSFVSTDPGLVIDTVLIAPIDTEPLVTFSGSKTLVAAGSFNDPLFGPLTATALLNPDLYTGTVTVDPGAQFTLVLIRDQITGDTTEVSTYELYEITRRWRANEWKADSVAQKALSTSRVFNTAAEDTIRIPLPLAWANNYRRILALEPADRLDVYRDEVFGFAIVHSSGNRVEYFNSNTSFLEIQNPQQQGDENPPAPIAVSMFQRATSYSVDLPVPAAEDNRVLVMNDFSKTGRITIQLSPDDYPINNISRAEVVLHEDFEQLQTSLRVNERRYSTGQIRIFELSEDEKAFYITKSPLTTIQRDLEGRYRIALTSFINNAVRDGREEITLYFTSDQDNGIIRPNMFINAGDPERAPKLIITTLTPSE
ncbi:MAG: hypothetical protein LAT52_07920 [Balneolales bacterium]|nr:hypothetical protein [Balneolales bacterium]